MEYVRKGGKQVMKKKIAVVLTALMVMAMGTTAFAATSPTTKTSETTTAEATAYANVTVAAGGIVIDGVASTAAPTVKAVTTAQVEAAQTQAVASVAPTAKVLQMIDVTLPVSFEKAQLTFSVNGVTAGQKIAVLHQKHDGSWEVINPDSVGNGTVTATFTSLSPIAFVAYNASAQTGEQHLFYQLLCLSVQQVSQYAEQKLNLTTNFMSLKIYKRKRMNMW